MAETILIEFQVEDGQLISAIDMLEKTGQIDAKMAAGFKQTTAEINKQAAAIKNDNTVLAAMQKNFDQLAAELKEQNQFLLGFKEGIESALNEAGVSLEEFFDALKNGPPAAEPKMESLKSQLRGLTEQLAVLKDNGEDNTEQFRKIAAEAGRLQDAIGDARQEVKNLASDTSAFDGLISAASGVTGAFAAGQGVIGLFGDENEELQKTLLRVNSAMAILQGLQQIQTVLQKESAAAQLLTNIQQKIYNAQIVIENGLQSQSIIVRGAATVAQKALNLAMAANPIGILVVAIAGLITILGTYGRNAAEARRQTSNLNVALGSGAKAFEDRTEALKQLSESSINALENEGAVDSRIAEQRVTNQQLLIDATKERLEALKQLEAESGEADLDKRKELNDEIRRLDDQLLTDRLAINNLQTKQQKVLQEEVLKNTLAGIEAQLSAAEQGSKKRLALEKQLITARLALELNADGLLANERAALIAKANQDRLDLEADFNKRRIELQLRGIETQLVNAEEGSEREFKLKLEQLRLQTAAEISSTKLSEAEKTAIKEKGFQEQLKLQREFNAKIRKEAIEGQISLNNAELVNIKSTADDRLLLNISNIELQASLEIEAAKGNANKIKEIIAKRDADIAATRRAFIEQQAADEIALRTALEGENNRALERIATEGIQKRSRITIKDIQENSRRRIIAIQQLAEFELKNIETREQALEEQRKKGLIGEQDYNLKYAQLQDEKAKLSEDTEKKITDTHKSESEKRKQIQQEFIELVINTTQQVLDIVGQINDIRAQKDQERLEGERARVQELLESGAITEKEAIARNKRIDAEEKKVKREAAQRDKNIAIFNAVINTAAAITKALPNLVLAGIAAALGAAQIAVIASRPTPKFKGGKKDKYQGPGVIGEAGAELFEHEGKMFLAKKETIVWLGKDDKVYTPAETKRMLPQVTKEGLKRSAETSGIDADKFAGKVADAVASVVKKMPQTSVTVDKDGINVLVQKGIDRINYMDKYYSSK